MIRAAVLGVVLALAAAAAQDQKSAHLRIGGSVTDPCGGAPCHSDLP